MESSTTANMDATHSIGALSLPADLLWIFPTLPWLLGAALLITLFVMYRRHIRQQRKQTKIIIELQQALQANNARSAAMTAELSGFRQMRSLEHHRSMSDHLARLKAAESRIKILRATQGIATTLAQSLDVSGEKTGSGSHSERVAPLQTLLRITGSQRGIRRDNLLNIIDQAREALAPMIKSKSSDFLMPEPPSEVFDLEAALLVDILKTLLLHHLCARSNTLVTISCVKRSAHIELRFSNDFTVSEDALHGDIPDDVSASWIDGCLLFPIISTTAAVPIEHNLTAIILEDHPVRRQALQSRLNLLGVRCTSDFQDRSIDFCFVSDTTTESFKTVQPLLDQKTVMIYPNEEPSQPANSKTEDAQARHHSLTRNNFITQVGLKRLIDQVLRKRLPTNILIVDDSEASRRMLEIQIHQLGLNAQTVSSGEQALERSRQEIFSHIFMDSQMPGLSGVQTTQLIRDNNDHSMIIGLTAHATPQEIQTYLDAGMDEVLQKPADIEIIGALLGEPSAGKEPSAKKEPSAGKEPSANKEPSADKEPSANKEHSTDKSPRPARRIERTMALPIFDPILSLKHANNRPDLAIELLQLLVKDLPHDRQALIQNASDTALLKASAHKLNGAVRYCGVPKLEQALVSLEQSIKSDRVQDFSALTRLVVQEMDQLIAWHAQHHHELDQLISRRA